jgi:mRNA interferase MazF
MKRGDVVLLDYPYANGSGSKVRPVLIVQNDRDNQRLTNTIVALITKNVSRVHEPTQLLIDVTTLEGQQSGLNQASAVTCGNLFTVAQTKVRRIVGSLSPAMMTRIQASVASIVSSMRSMASARSTHRRRVGSCQECLQPGKRS